MLFTISTLTTLLFIRGSFVVNAHWYVLYGGSARQDLRIGFFLWWLSFLLVALGLWIYLATKRVSGSCENFTGAAES